MGTIGNRQAINELIEVNDGLNDRVNTLANDIRNLLLSFKHFALRYMQIQQQTSMVYRSATQFQTKLTMFKLMIDAAVCVCVCGGGGGGYCVSGHDTTTSVTVYSAGYNGTFESKLGSSISSS